MPPATTNQNSDITIAIDGQSSTGKSTLAKALARRLGYAYVDSGAMYRAVTLYLLDNDLDYRQADDVEQALQNIRIEFRNIEGKNTTFLNGKNVEAEIRSLRVSNAVSPVSTNRSIRVAMREQQRLAGQHKGIVMDGRDIGTVVFPDAELKIFLTSDPHIRAQRRYEELLEKGRDVTLEQVAANLHERDHIDSNRTESPLRRAEDAVVLDNSYLSMTELVARAEELARARIHKLTSN